MPDRGHRSRLTVFAVLLPKEARKLAGAEQGPRVVILNATSITAFIFERRESLRVRLTATIGGALNTCAHLLNYSCIKFRAKSMRFAIAILMSVGMTAAAIADTGPVIVIPSRGGVPIIINGRDASFAVVEGDWGLGKGVHVQPTIYRGWPTEGVRPAGHYYPRTGTQPGYGRYEMNVPRREQPRAESYSRSWGAESPRFDEPSQSEPFEPPPVIYAPEFRGRR